MAFDPSMLPAVGESPWGEKFNDGYTQLFADVQDAMGSAAASAQSAADAAALVGAPAGSAIDAHLGGASAGLLGASGPFVRKGDLVVNVRDYGATGDGATDDTTAILAAQTAAGEKPLFFPPGTYRCSAKLTTRTILGANRQRTILVYTGTGSAIGVTATGVQSYHRRIEDMTIQSTGTAATGIELDAVSSGMFRNLLIKGFTQCVWMRAPNGGQCLYNVFHDVTVDQCTTGYRFDNISNENKFIACRVNGATSRGVDIRSGGHNVFDGGAIENANTGFYVEDPGGNLGRANVISNTRFEFCNNNIFIAAGVSMTLDIGNREIGGAHVDNGTGTIRVDVNTGAVSPGRYATAVRPPASSVTVGGMIYDTTLGKPLWSTGSAWKDAAGATV